MCDNTIEIIFRNGVAQLYTMARLGQPITFRANRHVKVRTSSPEQSLDITQYTPLKNCIDIEAECKPHFWNLRR
jgi:hypothetical protein